MITSLAENERKGREKDGARLAAMRTSMPASQRESKVLMGVVAIAGATDKPCVDPHTPLLILAEEVALTAANSIE